MKNKYLLLGGWSRSKHSYKKLLRSAPEDLEIFVLPHQDLDIHGVKNGEAADIIAFLENNKLDKVHLIGNSLGGAFAIQFAAQFPEKVSHLTLIDSVGIPTGDSIFSMSKKLFRTHVLSYGRKKIAENLYSVTTIFRSPLVHLKAGTFAYTVDVQDFAKKITVPTTILWGENDVMFPVQNGKILHELIKNSEFIVFPNLDHDWPLHRADLFWKHIR